MVLRSRCMASASIGATAIAASSGTSSVLTAFFGRGEDSSCLDASGFLKHLSNVDHFEREISLCMPLAVGKFKPSIPATKHSNTSILVIDGARYLPFLIACSSMAVMRRFSSFKSCFTLLPIKFTSESRKNFIGEILFS